MSLNWTHVGLRRGCAMSASASCADALGWVDGVLADQRVGEVGLRDTDEKESRRATAAEPFSEAPGDVVVATGGRRAVRRSRTCPPRARRRSSRASSLAETALRDAHHGDARAEHHARRVAPLPPRRGAALASSSPRSPTTATSGRAAVRTPNRPVGDRRGYPGGTSHAYLAKDAARLENISRVRACARRRVSNASRAAKPPPKNTKTRRLATASDKRAFDPPITDAHGSPTANFLPTPSSTRDLHVSDPKFCKRQRARRCGYFHPVIVPHGR